MSDTAVTPEHREFDYAVSEERALTTKRSAVPAAHRKQLDHGSRSTSTFMPGLARLLRNTARTGALGVRRILGVATLQAELTRIARRLDSLEAHARQETKWRGHITGKMDSLIRAQYLGDFLGTDYPFAATSRRFKLFSQNEEDGMVLALLQTAGVVTRTFVEIGSGGSGGNSGILSREFGWRGVMVDYDAENIERAARKFGDNPNLAFERLEVTPGNVDALIERNGLTGEVDFFSLDIDSFDYWVLKAMTACSPRVMVLEYNAHFGPEAAVTIAPDADLSKAPKGLHGASLAALVKLAATKGYRLLACDPSGTNAFFLRNDLRPEIAAVPVARAYKPMLDRGDPFGETPRAVKDLVAMAETSGVALVEV